MYEYMTVHTADENAPAAVRSTRPAACAKVGYVIVAPAVRIREPDPEGCTQ